MPPGSRLFIAGGTGFVGRALLRHLKRSDQKVDITVLSRNPDRFRKDFPDLCAGITLLSGDVRHFQCRQASFTHIVHGATETSAAAAARPVELAQTIVEGTRRMLEFARACGAAEFLYLSSGAVYGPQPEGLERIAESYGGAPDPSDPASAYGVAKRRAEDLCTLALAQHGTKIKVARLFAFVGEDLPLDSHFAIGNFIRDALARGAIEVKGDGSPVRSYLYQGDLALWLLEILQRAQAGSVYNIGSDQAVSMAQLASLVAGVVRPGTTVNIGKSRPDFAGRLRYVPAIDKAREELGLVPRVPLAEAIRRTAAFHGPR